ncbi:MAG: hypothetical protein K940chlam3_00857 [Chlamydiae bacterium]|nr:hypothetical protein [Chlamydiota bacterium]
MQYLMQKEVGIHQEYYQISAMEKFEDRPMSHVFRILFHVIQLELFKQI